MSKSQVDRNKCSFFPSTGHGRAASENSREAAELKPRIFYRPTPTF